MAKKKTKARKPAAKKAARKPAKKVARTRAKKAGVKVKKAGRKPAARRAAPPKRRARMPSPKAAAGGLPAEKQVPGGVLLGHVDDYFAHVGVVAIKLQAPLSVGDMIRIKGHTTDITQRVDSMQIEHQAVPTASPGDSVGIKIADRARRTDIVYKI